MANQNNNAISLLLVPCHQLSKRIEVPALGGYLGRVSEVSERFLDGADIEALQVGVAFMPDQPPVMDLNFASYGNRDEPSLQRGLFQLLREIDAPAVTGFVSFAHKRAKTAPIQELGFPMAFSSFNPRTDEQPLEKAMCTPLGAPSSSEIALLSRIRARVAGNATAKSIANAVGHAVLATQEPVRLAGRQMPEISGTGPLYNVQYPDGSAGLVDHATVAYYRSTLPPPSQALVDALFARTCKLRLFSGGCLADAPQGELVAELDGASEIASLREALEICDGGAGHATSYGDAAVQLLDDSDGILCSVSAHGDQIRFSVCRDDALAADPLKFLVWLDAYGVPGPLEQLREHMARETKANHSYVRWNENMPACLAAEKPELSVPAIRAHLDANYAERTECIRDLLIWLASGSENWAQPELYELMPHQILATYPNEAIYEAMETVSTGPALLGCARFFATSDSSQLPLTPVRNGQSVAMPPATLPEDFPESLQRTLHALCSASENLQISEACAQVYASPNPM